MVVVGKKRMGEFVKYCEPLTFGHTFGVIFDPKFAVWIRQDSTISSDVKINCLASDIKHACKDFWAKRRAAPATRLGVSNFFAGEPSNDCFGIALSRVCVQKSYN
jgi:hypothetical protein